MSNYKIRLRNLPSFREEVLCMMGCPIHTDSGKYVQLVAEEKYQEGYLISRSPNPFASVCGRVCAAPCEDNCRKGNVNINEPISIRSLKKFLCERFGVESKLPDTQKQLFEGEKTYSHMWSWDIPLLEKQKKKNKKVAVIGAGVGGLACAHDLALIGYQVTIFEASEKAGGMVRYGIPKYRLPEDVLDKEISVILNLGVEIKYNTPLTSTFGISEIKKQGYEAIFIAVGAQQGRDLKIEGSDLKGVYKAIDYLVGASKGEEFNLGKKVIVIGGGLVALDAARDALRSLIENTQKQTLQETIELEKEEIFHQGMFETLDVARKALRQGAIEVNVVSLESEEEMSAARSIQGKAELEETKDEGIKFYPGYGPKRIIGEEQKVKGMEFQKVISIFDKEGKFNPTYDKNQTITLEADAVILAIGQTIDLSFIKEEDHIEITPRGNIKIDIMTLATSAEGIYAGGDCAFGPRNLIDAIANGKVAASSIDKYLSNKKKEISYQVEVKVLSTSEYEMPENYDKNKRKTPEVLPPERRIGLQEIEQSFTEKEAKIQGGRCLKCHISPIYNSELCIICGRCTDVCPENCLEFVPLEEVDLKEEDKKNIYENLSYPENELVTVFLKNDEKCIRCGLCAIRCPTAAITMEQIIVQEEVNV